MCSRIENLNITRAGCECLWVKIPNSKGGVLLICVVYLRPKSGIEVYKSFFYSLQQINISGNSNLIVVGDFNLQIYGSHFRLNEGDNFCKELLLFLNLHNLS